MDEITRRLAPTGAIPGILTVQVDQLKNFRSDVTVPYVVVELGNQKMQTDMDDTNPEMKNKFYFETDLVEPNAAIFITVMNGNKGTAQKPIGYFSVAFQKIAKEKNVKFDNEPLKAEKIEDANAGKQVEGNITLSFLFAPYLDNDAITDNLSMKNLNYDGVLKLTVLRGTNLTNLETLNKFKYLFLEIYHNKATNPKPYVTDKKKQKNAQFNETSYFKINKDSKFLINLMNVEKYRFLAGAYEFAVKDYENLVRNKPQTFPLVLTDNYLFKAQLFCEMTFFHHSYFNEPFDKVIIQVLSLPKPPGKNLRFSLSFEDSGGDDLGGHEMQLMSRSCLMLENIGMLLKINLICSEQGSTDVARGQFYLCELRWAKQNSDVEYQAKKTVELVGKNSTMTVSLALKSRPKNSLKENP